MLFSLSERQPARADGQLKNDEPRYGAQSIFPHAAAIRIKQSGAHRPLP
jgi:hypothetical protein